MLGTLQALKRTLTATPAEGRAQAKLLHAGIVRVTGK